MLIIVIIIVAVIALGGLLRGGSKFRWLPHFESESSPRLRISVVVVGATGVEYITSLLSIESNSYEVVLVADFANDQGALHALCQRFGLIKVNYTSNGEIGEETLRGLYRSFRRIYSRLVVVDSAPSDLYAPFEVGAMLSRYDYILHISSHRTLRYDAIDNLLLELAMRPEGSVISIDSHLLERFHLSRRDILLSEGVAKGFKKRGERIKIDYRILK